MERLEELVQDPSSWTATVAPSLVLSVVGNLLTRWFERRWGGLAAWNRRQKEAAVRRRETEIGRLMASPGMRQFCYQFETRTRQRATMALVTGVGVMLGIPMLAFIDVDPGRVAIMGGAAFAAFFVWRDVANRAGRDVDEALKRLERQVAGDVNG